MIKVVKNTSELNDTLDVAKSGDLIVLDYAMNKTVHFNQFTTNIHIVEARADWIGCKLFYSFEDLNAYR
jgi:hypothetical protein